MLKTIPLLSRSGLAAFACLLGLAALNAVATLEPARAGEIESKVDAKALLGKWKVDLRPKPGAADYFKEFEVKSVDGNVLAGTFYGSDFNDGRINTDWGVVHFAFSTKDQGGGVYNTSGTLRDGKLDGLTHAVDRKFLSVWRASRPD